MLRYQQLYTLVDVEALPPLSQQVEDEKRAVNGQSSGGRVPDKDVAQ